MAAGLGFKDFTTGEVLTAADVDGYLMQGVWVFASATARDAAVTSPQEGNFAYLKDTNVTTYYTGSAWANLDTTGMTNPMTTTGDTIYSSSGSTPARLGIGTAGQVLQVNSGATAPEWATPASGSTFVGCRLYRTTAQTLANGTTTSIQWNNESFDSNSFHDNSTNNTRITIPSGKSGKYLFAAQLLFNSNAAGQRMMRFVVNNTTITSETYVPGNAVSGAIVATNVIDLVAGDYVEVRGYQNSGGNLDINGDDANYNFVSAYLIGA